MIAGGVDEVVRAVVGGGGVVVGAHAVELLVEAGAAVAVEALGALEEKVFEEVGGAGCADDFVTRADPVGGHHGDDRCGGVAHEEELEAVGDDLKLADAAELAYEGDVGGRW